MPTDSGAELAPKSLSASTSASTLASSAKELRTLPMQSGRDRILDGFRTYAVMAVIAGHAMAYRFADAFESGNYILHQIRSMSGPLADFGVYLFFGISGYIITHLLLREEVKRGRISIPAFYLRRLFRILPPLLAYLATLFVLDQYGTIDTETSQLPRALFTCNLGVYECAWYTAHTWSLAVEEQFYLVWPILFFAAAAVWRPAIALIALAALMIFYAFSPWVFHSNAMSFSCIAAGVVIALKPEWRTMLAERINTPIWIAAIVLAVLGPRLFGYWFTGMLMPGLVVIAIFGAYRIRWLEPFLTNRPVQWIAAMSYSLYLWQQLFLASPVDGYSLPVWLLPVAAYASMVLVERPFMKISHRLSRKMSKPPVIDTSAGATR